MRIACGISGGIDSAISALMLRNHGYDVTGIFMKNWDDQDEICTLSRDRDDARYVCRTIGIPYLEVNFVKSYWNNVFSRVLQDYKNGVTPNPDVLCNKVIKFNSFYNHCVSKGFDLISTGHYARKEIDLMTNKARLLKSIDDTKDQTFFLCQISQAVLQKTIFPLGNYLKSEVKNIGLKEPGFERIAKKRESFGMCFIGNKKFQNFMNEYVEPNPGRFIHIESGEILGYHFGIHLWTVGQRCPSRISNQDLQSYYVASMDNKTQDIVVAPGANHPSLFRQSLIVENPHWIHSDHLADVSELVCEFRYIHGYPVLPCRISKALRKDRCEIYFEKPLRGLKTGQVVVLYLGEECLGGARIIEVGPSLFDIALNNIS